MPVLIDSGFRRGADIVKSLAFGACGQEGVEHVLELLRIEHRAAMQQADAHSIKHLVPGMVKRARGAP